MEPEESQQIDFIEVADDLVKPVVSEIPLHDGHDFKSLAVLPWDKFSNWIHCACVVTFDLELGQAMEVTFNSFVYCFL